MNINRFEFRAWIVEKQEMRYMVDGFHLSSTYVSPTLKPVLEIPPYVDEDRYIIDEECFFMQCTGLKDSEGKLVYEGDVVEVDDRAIGAPNISIGQVYYCLDYTLESNPCFAAYGNNGHFRLSPSIKVLGNRYQHPELLEGER